jgi:hypothetical protein
MIILQISKYTGRLQGDRECIWYRISEAKAAVYFNIFTVFLMNPKRDRDRRVTVRLPSRDRRVTVA